MYDHESLNLIPNISGFITTATGRNPARPFRSLKTPNCNFKRLHCFLSSPLILCHIKLVLQLERKLALSYLFRLGKPTCQESQSGAPLLRLNDKHQVRMKYLDNENHSSLLCRSANDNENAGYVSFQKLKFLMQKI